MKQLKRQKNKKDIKKDVKIAPFSFNLKDRTKFLKDNIETYFEKGCRYCKQGDYEKALENYRKSLENFEKVLDSENLCELYANMASVYSKQGDYEKALENYGKALEINPEYIAIYNNIGTLYSEQGDYEKALENYGKALKIDPEYVVAYNNIGALYEKQGDYEKALENYGKSLDIDRQDSLEDTSDYAETFVNVGNVYSKQGDYEKALENYKKALEINLKSTSAYHNMGYAYVKQGDYEEALNTYQKSFEYENNYAKVYANIASVYSEQGDSEKALENYKKALENNPEYVAAYNNIGVLYEKQGDYEKALENYEKALKFNSKLVEAHINISVVYLKKKQYEDSLKHLKKILKIERKENFQENIGLGLLEIFEEYRIQEEDFNLLITNKLYFSYKVLQKIVDNIKIIDDNFPKFKEKLIEDLKKNIIKDNFKRDKRIKKSEEIFYMCKSINKYTIESIINKGIYKNKVTNFNDPFDPYFKMLNSDIVDELKKVRITCFSEEFDNLLLWAHYGDNHRGICLGYNIMENENSYFEKIIYKSLKMIRKMNYVAKEDLCEFNIGEDDITLSDFYLRKNENWQYEKEHRLIHLDITSEEDYYKNVALKEVIFGMNTEVKDIKLIYEIVKNAYDKSNDITFYKMREGKDLTIEKYLLKDWAKENKVTLDGLI